MDAHARDSGIIIKITSRFQFAMTIWLCEHDSSHFIMFRQVEVIRNGLQTAAEFPRVADMSDPIDIVAMPLHSPKCIYGIDCVRTRQKTSLLFIGNPMENAGFILIRH